jgi:hypothetical protein
MPSGGARPNTGGPREGAGRKRIASKWSDAFKRSLLRAIKAKIKETGKSPQDVIVEILYAEYQKPRDRVAAYKTISDAFVEKSSHKTVEEHKHTYAPVVLPQMKDDPSSIDMGAKPINPSLVN